MRLLCATLIFSVILIVSLAQNQPTAKRTLENQRQSRAYVEHRDGATLYVTEDASFDFIQLLKPSGQGYDVLLLDSLQRNERNFEAEGLRSTLRVRALKVQGASIRKQLWSFVTTGNEGHAVPELGLYQATSWPCCSAMWVHEYFSLCNGKHLFTTNGSSEDAIGGPNSGLLRISGNGYADWRFVAFGASYEKGHEQPTLQYGTDRELKQRFELHGHEYGDNFDVPKVTLLDADGKPFTDLTGALNFTIVLHFEGDQEPETELRIPVVADVIRPDLAVLPRGYSLTLLPN